MANGDGTHQDVTMASGFLREAMNNVQKTQSKTLITLVVGGALTAGTFAVSVATYVSLRASTHEHVFSAPQCSNTQCRNSDMFSEHDCRNARCEQGAWCHLYGCSE